MPISRMKSHAEKDDGEVLGARKEGGVGSLLTMEQVGDLLGAHSDLKSAVIDLWLIMSSRAGIAYLRSTPVSYSGSNEAQQAL